MLTPREETNKTKQKSYFWPKKKFLKSFPVDEYHLPHMIICPR
jgi:hypothetical protein